MTSLQLANVTLSSIQWIAPTPYWHLHNCSPPPLWNKCLTYVDLHGKCLRIWRYWCPGFLILHLFNNQCWVILMDGCYFNWRQIQSQSRMILIFKEIMAEETIAEFQITCTLILSVTVWGMPALFQIWGWMEDAIGSWWHFNLVFLHLWDSLLNNINSPYHCRTTQPDVPTSWRVGSTILILFCKLKRGQ